MNVVAIIQARMSSTRLPGKVLMPLSGHPVLKHIINRLNTCKTFEKIVVATSIDETDNKIETFCNNMGVAVYRGSLSDVLDRFYQTAKLYNADAILRITADCPVIDPEIVDLIVNSFKQSNYDLCGLSGNFPDGLDCSVFSFSAIEKAWNNASLASEREHVGPYIENNPHIFNILPIELFDNLQDQRWTLDEPNDYIFLKAVFEELYCKKKIFLTQDILDLLAKKPDLLLINDKIKRNEGFIKSKEKD